MVDHVSASDAAPTTDADQRRTAPRRVDDSGLPVRQGIGDERPVRSSEQAAGRVLRIEALNERLVERAAARRAAILGALVA